MSSVGVAWLRAEYQGREAELVTLSEGADLVGVSRSTVSMWAARHQDFPKLALVTGSPRKRTKYVVREELVAFAQAQQRRGVDRSAKRPARPGAEIAADQVQRCEAVLAELIRREEKQRAALGRTLAARARTEERLTAARTRLKAEIAAARAAEESQA
ncbi:hypothetical protein PJ985_22950 [Streptomyces sp. ACA25]|uniref:hypothetical protein n=1 Tax=Streptomyces sp. ACA25 TaxID=3022596 RepID=UPI00230832B1|nr:hypothetical protein [Streptomyces sp. ACA25]MDB1090411.1 hypothetical protein [Streptomyces sp. ACA25]